MEHKTTPTTSSPTNSSRPFKDSLFSVKEFNRRFANDSRFREFAKQVYHYLDGMKVGKMLNLTRYSGEKLEWIVLTTAAFIAEGTHSLDYQFTNDFKAVEHVYVDPEIIEHCRVTKYGDNNNPS